MRVAWMIGLGIACGTVAARAGVEIGDPAPRLDGSLAWLQGDPLDPSRTDRPTRLALVFWSPASGSGTEMFSRLQSLADRHPAGLQAAAVTSDEAETVRAWLEREGIRLPIALDTNRTTEATYLSDVEGLPYAFLINTNGLVAWSGDPLAGLEDAAEELLAGTYDQDRVRAERRRRAELDRALDAGDYPKALVLADELLAGAPQRPDLLRLKAGLLVETGDTAGYREHTRRMAAAFADSAQDLNNLAWTLAGPSDLPLAFRDLETAHAAAHRAAELTQRKEAVVLDTLAAVLFQLGLCEQAADTQAEAVAASADPAQRKQFGDTLEYYRRIPAWRDAARTAKPAAEPPPPPAVTAPSAPDATNAPPVSAP